MSRPSTFRYFAREAVRDLWDRRAVTILSAATIAASLYLVGVFLLAARGVEGLLGRWANELSVSIFLADGATEEQMGTLRNRIAGSEAVRSFEYLDRKTALERFRRDFPDLSDLPGELDDNPFPASFEIQLRPEEGTAERVAGFARPFSGLPGVADVRFDALWVEKLRAILRSAGFGGAAIGILLLGAAVLTISAVVRMGIYARRDEIEILRLVGATPGFIRAPFLIEGALQGFGGAVAALGGIAITTLALSGSAGALSLSLLGELLGASLRLVDAAFLLGGGTLLGLGGSILAGMRD